MAIFNFVQGEDQCVHFGLSSDTKPAGEGNGHTFIEIDTGKVFLVEAGEWVEKLNSGYSTSGHSHSGLAPTGGTTGQVLKKASNTNYDYAWDTDQTSAGGDPFPVGSVFIAVVATNPGTLLGYGTWSAFAAGRVLVGIDAGQTEFDTVEETGGAKTHTLTTAEMPSHTHVQNAHNHQILRERSATTGAATTLIARTSDTSSTVDTNVFTENATPTNQDTGGGGAHNNLQPYIVVYMWKRTA